MANSNRQFGDRAGNLMINLKRFEEKCQPDPAGSDCIIWTGVKNNIGYPFMGARDIVSDRYKMVTAHRVALMLKLGRPIQPGMNANHSCHTRLCVNPAHLSEGTQQQKIRDMNRDGRHRNNGQTDRGSYNHKQHNRVYKYSDAEIQWIRNATVLQVRQKYNLDLKRGASFRCQIRNGYKWLPWVKK